MLSNDKGKELMLFVVAKGRMQRWSMAALKQMRMETEAETEDAAGRINVMEPSRIMTVGTKAE